MAWSPEATELSRQLAVELGQIKEEAVSDLHDKLAAPFDEKELKFFPVALTKDKTKGRVGSYVDARAVMERLDKVVGPGGWQTTHRCIDPAEKAVECTLSLLIDGQWVAKSDVGYPNEARDADNPEKEPWKAAYSDSLKRAAVQFGIGRYIYSLELEKDWLPVDQYGKFAEQPRLRGATQQDSGNRERRDAQPSGAPAATPPKPVSIARPTFIEYMATLNFTADEVEVVSQEMFGNRSANALTGAEKLQLQAELEGRRIKAQREVVRA